MVDLAKCHGTGCPLRDGCYRFTAPASDPQWYAAFNCDPDTGCPHFLPARQRAVEPKAEPQQDPNSSPFPTPKGDTDR